MENKNKNVSLENEATIINSLTELFTEANLEYDGISTSETETTIIATLSGNQKGKVVGIIAYLSPQSKSLQAIYEGVSTAIQAITRLKNGSSFSGTIKLMISVARSLPLAHVGIEELAFIGYTSDLDTVLVIEPTQDQYENVLMPLTFVTEGLSVHGSAPQIGINAIDHMRIFLKRLETLLTTTEEEVANSYHVLENLEGGSAPNTIPDDCKAIVNIYTTLSAYQAIRRGIDAIKLELENELRRFRLTITESGEIQNQIGDWARQLPVILLAPGEITDDSFSKYLR
ncbi:MAG: peptidase dimerization domain-containing protein [Tannerellaceae bacterium]|nr:peptidase dimerization domain-containing protein [Tannerellaceae bacterium]